MRRDLTPVRQTRSGGDGAGLLFRRVVRGADLERLVLGVQAVLQTMDTGPFRVGSILGHPVSLHLSLLLILPFLAWLTPMSAGGS